MEWMHLVPLSVFSALISQTRKIFLTTTHDTPSYCHTTQSDKASGVNKIRGRLAYPCCDVDTPLLADAGMIMAWRERKVPPLFLLLLPLTQSSSVFTDCIPFLSQLLFASLTCLLSDRHLLQWKRLLFPKLQVLPRSVEVVGRIMIMINAMF